MVFVKPNITEDNEAMRYRRVNVDVGLHFIQPIYRTAPGAPHRPGRSHRTPPGPGPVGGCAVWRRRTVPPDPRRVSSPYFTASRIAISFLSSSLARSDRGTPFLDAIAVRYACTSASR